MTWTQWCDNSYNYGTASTKFKVATAVGAMPTRIVKGNVYEPVEAVGYNGTFVTPTDIIIADRAYVKTTYSPVSPVVS